MLATLAPATNWRPLEGAGDSNNSGLDVNAVDRGRWNASEHFIFNRIHSIQVFFFFVQVCSTYVSEVCYTQLI